MKISVTLKQPKDNREKGLSNICFRVREKAIDIKVVSEITVNERYWDNDTLAYRRNNVVPKEEQKNVPAQIAAVIERATETFTHKADSTWLKEIIEEVMHPQLAFERKHPYIVARVREYYEQYEGTASSKSGILDLERKLTRYHRYRQTIDGETDFRLFVETITLDDINDFRDYITNEHTLRMEYPGLYEGCFSKQNKPKPISGTTVINVMNLLCVFLKWCRKMGYTDSEAFLQYGCKTPVYGDPFFLTIEERNILYDADLSKCPKLAAIRDIFVFHCYIGCRVGDLYRLTRDNIKDGFVEYMPQKTKKCQAKTVRVPLHEKAKAILDRYIGDDTCKGKLLPFKNIAVYNNGIRELLRHCGIDRMVTILDTHGYETVQRPLYEVATSHTARKTFVGNLYRQVPDPNLIASMSGHVEGSRAFKRYRNIDDDMKRRLVDMIN